jgi:peptidyl-prolyl cis-trans isomerase D
LSEEVIKGTKGYYLIRLKERKTPDAAGFEAEKENIEKSLMEQKKRKAYEAWLSQLKERSDIAIEEKLFE